LTGGLAAGAYGGEFHVEREKTGLTILP